MKPYRLSPRFSLRSMMGLSPIALTLAALGACTSSADVDEELVNGNDALVLSTITEGDYVLRTALSGKCVDIWNASVDNGAAVQEYDCNGTQAQTFHIRPVGGGYYTIVNVKSGKYISVAYASVDPGMELLQWDFQDIDTQRFSFTAQSDGSYGIYIKRTQFAMDVRGGLPDNGTRIQQYPWNGSAAQRWTLTRVDVPSTTSSSSTTTSSTTTSTTTTTTSTSTTGAGGAGGTGGTGGTGGGVPVGRGMDVPWVEFQAENGLTNATVIGPSRAKWDANHIEAEAIGRKAVRLNRTGDYVSFRTTAAANSIVVRYSIPDSVSGGGIDATLGLYVNGTRVKSLPLTSRYSWSYKGGLIGNAIVDTPAEQPHTFFDEVRTLLTDIPVGAEVKLQRDGQDTAAFYVIDLVDFEQVAPPLTMPAGFRSVTEFGIQPNDGVDHADDIARAMQSTSKLWFPPGTYLAQRLASGNVGLDNPGTEVRGAGMWHTTLKGPKALFFCYGASTACVFKDFSIFGEAKARAEETQGVQKAFAGPLGRNSILENLWIEHEVGAIWVGNDPPYQTAPTQNLTIRNVRIRNTYADGINLDNGTSSSLVENCHMRNVGDDAAVVWSIKWTDWVKEKTYSMGPDFIKPEGKNAPDQGVGHGNTFRKISVQMPWRANCFASYGGYDNHFLDSTCEDVLTYPGILIDNEFSPYPFGPGITEFRNISLIRAGGPMFFEGAANPWKHGALKFYLREGDVNDILVENVDIIDPTYSGIEFRGFGTAYVPPGERFDPDVLRDADNARFRNVTLRNVKVTNAGTYGIEVLDSGGKGTVNFESVVVTNSALGALNKGTAPDSFFNKVIGNQGW